MYMCLCVSACLTQMCMCLCMRQSPFSQILGGARKGESAYLSVGSQISD